MTFDCTGAIFISTLATQKLAEEDPDNAQARLLIATMEPIVSFMVLCSIIIHGLSIPSFSLGRRMHTVSRTWSRHAAPDWMNSTRLVHRGDDIVINRDAEKGVETFENSTPISVPGSDVATIGGEVQSGNEETQGARVVEDADADVESAVVQEWPEGDQVIVERQEGPGEDVSTHAL
jgi:sodium/hydrogen antiporter